MEAARRRCCHRLHTTLAESRLELGYLIQHDDARRGGLRGQGVELASAGWGNVHAAQGLLLSASARPDGTSTQMDIGDAMAQLKGAERTAEALHDTLQQQQVPGFDANPQLAALREALDPEADGAYSGSVAGQPAMKPADGREICMSAATPRISSRRINETNNPRLRHFGPGVRCERSPRRAIAHRCRGIRCLGARRQLPLGAPRRHGHR
ncbi:type VI secretion system Vgr family protein [Luteimonas abyssi]|uniref:type VI secretion system Vgr family protein n=1 Tax=Luteimonas abyssi TaxID=1247514 RepID=UPI000ACA79A5